ncbi:MAG: PRC-barrel domain-containing protein [Prochlorotrichaceae cyanobacterium]|jgi:sporulation protein YlmC with PRC-barrel domain
MTSEQIWQRTELLGTQVITRDTGKRLGLVNELLVDVNRREVVALGLRDNALSRVLPGVGMTTYLYLENIRQIGDVILVDSDEAIEDIDPERYSLLINSEVRTENNEFLGRVRSFNFDIETGKIEALVIASLSAGAVPDVLISTYELPIEEIASTGPDRIIVFEGAEERLVQLTVGVMEKLGLGTPPWERDDEEDFSLPITPAENQLGTGEPLRPPVSASKSSYQSYGQPYRQPVNIARPAPESNAWDEDTWDEEPELIEPARRPATQQLEARPYYNDYEPSGREWTEAMDNDRPRERPLEMPRHSSPPPVSDDANWDDDEDHYEAPRINIPQKKRQLEYEEDY